MKPLQFKIVYKDTTGKEHIEMIEAECWSDAKAECERRGEFIKCEYQHTATDLLYLH